jgi:hypothetical protein
LTPYEIHEWIAARVAKYNHLPNPPFEVRFKYDAEGIRAGVYRRNEDGIWVRIAARARPPPQSS